jgi:hypothetical protein
MFVFSSSKTPSASSRELAAHAETARTAAFLFGFFFLVRALPFVVSKVRRTA